MWVKVYAKRAMVLVVPLLVISEREFVKPEGVPAVH